MSLDWAARLRSDVLIDHIGGGLGGSHAGGSVRGPAALLLAGLLSLGPVSGAVAQPSLRVGVSISRTGAYAELAPTMERGYQLCVRHTNEKGGVLGRKLELVTDDDRSEPATAARIYERLITRDKVEAILGPYSSPITEAVADLAEKHQLPLVTAGAATTSIFKKGRRFVFMLPSPAEAYFEGLVDMAVRRRSWPRLSCAVHGPGSARS